MLAAVHKDMLELTANVGTELITGNVASAVQHESKASAFVMDDVASVFTGVIALLVALMETVTAIVVVVGTVSTTLLQLEGTTEGSLSVIFAIWAVFLLLSANAGRGEALLLGVGDGEAKLEVKAEDGAAPEDTPGADKTEHGVREGMAVTVATLAKDIGRLTREGVGKGRVDVVRVLLATNAPAKLVRGLVLILSVYVGLQFEESDRWRPWG